MVVRQGPRNNFEIGAGGGGGGTVSDPILGGGGTKTLFLILTLYNSKNIGGGGGGGPCKHKKDVDPEVTVITASKNNSLSTIVFA